MHDIYWKRGRRKRISLKLDLSSSSSDTYSLHSIWQSSVSLPFPPTLHYTALPHTAPLPALAGWWECFGAWEAGRVISWHWPGMLKCETQTFVSSSSYTDRCTTYADKAVSEVGILSWHQHQALKLYVLALYLLVISSMFPGRFYKLQSEYFTSYGWNTKQAVLLRWFTRRIGN